jgi:hypothetical protein
MAAEFLGKWQLACADERPTFQSFGRWDFGCRRKSARQQLCSDAVITDCVVSIDQIGLHQKIGKSAAGDFTLKVY